MHPPLYRRLFFAAALLAAAAVSQAIELPLPPLSPPGLPGRIDIGRLPLPQVVIQQPTIIIRPPALPPLPGVVVVQPGATPPAPPPPPPRTAPAHPHPVYMWVPPGHRKDWKKHCHRYKACGVHVLFVRDDWYDRHVHRGAKHRDDDDDDDDDKRRGGRGHGHGKGDGKGDDKRRGKGD